jgi:hypothetical protein
MHAEVFRGNEPMFAIYFEVQQQQKVSALKVWLKF